LEGFDMSEDRPGYASEADLQDALALLGNQEVPENPVGFASPNYTQTPNDLFEIMMRDMDCAELKVVLAIVRLTYGYHRTFCKAGIKDLRKMTGLSYGGVVLGAKYAERRGVIRRTNPNDKTKAEWEIIETPSTVEGVKVKHPQRLRVVPSTVEGQVGLNKDKEKNTKESSPSKDKRRIPEGFPTPSGDLVTDWMEASRAMEEKTLPAAAVLERLTALNRNWPRYGENKNFDRVVKLILAAEKDRPGMVEQFVRWVHNQKDAQNTIRWYGMKPENIWRDWGVCFAEAEDTTYKKFEPDPNEKNYVPYPFDEEKK